MDATTNTFIRARARIDQETKVKASAALQAMGLSVSDALRILLRRIAADQAFPPSSQEPKSRCTRPYFDTCHVGIGQ